MDQDGIVYKKAFGLQKRKEGVFNDRLCFLSGFYFQTAYKYGSSNFKGKKQIKL